MNPAGFRFLRRGDPVLRRPALHHIADIDPVPGQLNRFQHPQDTQSIHIPRVFRDIKADLHMALCRKIVNLIRLNPPHNRLNAAGVRKISIMELDLIQNMINPLRIHRRSSPGHPVHLVSFFQQQFRQIGPVLSGNPRNQRFFHSSVSPLSSLKQSLFTKTVINKLPYASP